MAGRLPPGVSERLHMGNVFYSAERRKDLHSLRASSVSDSASGFVGGGGGRKGARADWWRYNLVMTLSFFAHAVIKIREA